MFSHFLNQPIGLCSCSGSRPILGLISVASIHFEIWGIVDPGEKIYHFCKRNWNIFPILQNISLRFLRRLKFLTTFLVIDSKMSFYTQNKKNYVYSLYSRCCLHDIGYNNIFRSVHNPPSQHWNFAPFIARMGV